MAEAKKQPNRKLGPATPWQQRSVDLESLTPDERLAHELVVRRPDLTPSVERIMMAELSHPVRSAALTAFSESLQMPGDPNRDPRVAIANATARAGKN
jgi:hypothetical protein